MLRVPHVPHVFVERGCALLDAVVGLLAVEAVLEAAWSADSNVAAVHTHSSSTATLQGRRLGKHQCGLDE